PSVVAPEKPVEPKNVVVPLDALTAYRLRSPPIAYKPEEEVEVTTPKPLYPGIDPVPIAMRLPFKGFTKNKVLPVPKYRLPPREPIPPASPAEVPSSLMPRLSGLAFRKFHFV